MGTHQSPLAGQPAPASVLIDVGKLLAAYFSERPDPSVAAQRVAFGTSGHRGSSFDVSFNEWHVLAITQAICDYRRAQGIVGPLFLGIDTHALSQPACDSALEVLAANGVEVMLASGGEFTPTPAVSHAILAHNRSGNTNTAQADGIVVTPSHNPPRDGGFKYNPPHGGPAGSDITQAIGAAANRYLEQGLQGVRRMPLAQALRASTTHRHDFLRHYVDDLDKVIDMEAIRASGLRLGVDPLGGAGVHYWPAIAERWQIDLSVLSTVVDPQFGFMTLDWDGQIRMDPSSRFAMERLIAAKDRFDIAFACDTDHDRHGIVTPGAGLLAPNHYLSVVVDYLFRHRPQWSAHTAVGKTVVTTELIERVAARLKRAVFDVPVGFKWFSQGLLDGSLGFAGEESAGAAFLRRDGRAWTTDKDGITAALLAAEITAVTGSDPGRLYGALTADLGEPAADRVEAPANAQQKQTLAALSADQITATTLAGETITSVCTQAPGNGATIGGIKVSAPSGWYAARPSGTEDIYKIYGESFRGAQHLAQILAEAQKTVDVALQAASS
ncbi:MAG: alpha-D-glucose phosphate-specific phosphoglucomutase [Simplicispira suum]|uniref:phosphoglucomutase (alpha-D-glucose-1,6-bisphosphate-dependent) n=1 Tax=Simplicispira suum TaxID=2109915 RepID=UPI001C6BA47A|nr:phosphoglucomutase (alpha-D-glucose-1,6-bisphosphate-dependent) [Simplicispira suum]MBW7833724.1 alpha-D-glucose phosphate-specific phosphoglucomutase [Simplicispira suum]